MTTTETIKQQYIFLIKKNSSWYVYLSELFLLFVALTGERELAESGLLVRRTNDSNSLISSFEHDRCPSSSPSPSESIYIVNLYKHWMAETWHNTQQSIAIRLMRLIDY